MSDFMEIFEPAAKELYDVWTAVIEADIRKHNFQIADDSWDTLPALQKAAWLAVAVHVTKEVSELLEMLKGGKPYTQIAQEAGK